MALKPARLLEKLPTPVPSDVFEFVIVGPEVVLQQTPFAVIEEPPSEVIVPPRMAEITVILL